MFVNDENVDIIVGCKLNGNIFIIDNLVLRLLYIKLASSIAHFFSKFNIKYVTKRIFLHPSASYFQLNDTQTHSGGSDKGKMV